MKRRDNYLEIIRQSSVGMEPIATNESAVLKPLNNIEAVLLDVYGTLFISSCGDINVGDNDTNSFAFRDVLANAGLNLHISGKEGVRCLRQTIENFHSRSRQSGVEFPEVDIVEVWRQLLFSLSEGGQVEGDLDQVDLFELSLRYELATNPVWPMPGAANCLTELASRGIVLGLVSNAQWFTSLLFPALLGGELDALGIGSDLQFWSYRVGSAKPGQQLFRLAAETFHHRGISPQNILHVGNDMLNDIATAAKVGFRTALFAGDQRSLRRREDRPCLADVSPELVVLQLRDLLTCLRPDKGE